MRNSLKKIALLTATELEITPLIEKFHGVTSQSVFDIPIWTYRTDKHEVFFTVSGIGKTNASYVTGVLCALYNIDFIVHFGIAGIYNHRGNNMGDVVVIEKCFLGDEGVIYSYENHGSYKDIGIPVLVKGNGTEVYAVLETHPDLIQLVRKSIASEHFENFNILFGKAVSVSMTSGAWNIANFRRKKFDATIEDMETAAVMIAGHRSGVPVLPVRGISNVAGDRNRANWKIDLALRNTVQVILTILDAIGVQATIMEK